MKLFNLLLTVLFFLFVPTAVCFAQKDSATGVGSSKFKINSNKKFWMGSNYRREWKTPVKAEVLNMATEKGGLTPVRLGGGKQSKSLRVEDPTGRQYSLRLIEKFITSKTLPADLQSKAAEDLVADGVSASYPYSTLSIPPFSDALGIQYGKVRLVYIPDDPRLGEFKTEFANRLAFFEERLPEAVKKGQDSYDVAMKLKEDNDDDVDEKAVLRVRILDMYVMDFDRHEDQWQWGAIDKEKGKTYFPIPRDRDQAFFINQGLVPGMAKWPWVVPQLEGFKPKSKNINRFNFAARNFDRFFLTRLNKDDWKNEVDAFLPKMTDELIEKAINQQPPEIRNMSGDKLISILKERRKYLPGEMMQYYRFLAQTVSIPGSDKKELFEINRNNDGSVQVQVYKITKEGEQSIKMYDRVFDPKDTKELHLYAFGGDDKFVVKGGKSKIKLRMIGGDGTDLFENKTGNKGGMVYDTKSGGNKLDGKFTSKMSDKDTAVNSYDRLGFKYNQVIPFVSITYDRDDGIYLGASVKFIKQGFRKSPYQTMHQFNVNHSLQTKAYNFRYYSEFIGVIGRTGDLVTEMDIKAPDNTTNFFGYGDTSVYDKTKPGQFRYYRARYQLGDISFMLRKRFTPQLTLAVGPTYEFYKLDADDNTGRNILNTGINGLDSNTLFASQSFIGAKTSFIMDTRDDEVMPQKGVYWKSSFRYLYGLNDKSNTIGQLNSDLSIYVYLIQNTLVWANRIGAGVNWGNFNFYQAQYLGSENNLRGYRKYRFAGRSKIYNNTELRLRLANFRTYLFPAAFGVMAFYDAGRIYDDNNFSNRWITGYGGGVWIAPLKRLVISLSWAASKEDKLPLFGVSWKF
jgi:hypothetical protein